MRADGRDGQGEGGSVEVVQSTRDDFFPEDRGRLDSSRQKARIRLLLLSLESLIHSTDPECST